MQQHSITCRACGHTASVHLPGVPDEHILRCDECGARTAYGTLMPRIVVEPFIDERGRQWCRKRYQDATTRQDLYVVDVDPQYAAMEAKNVLSLVIP
jgi:hypothetical protein